MLLSSNFDCWTFNFRCKSRCELNIEHNNALIFYAWFYCTLYACIYVSYVGQIIMEFRVLITHCTAFSDTHNRRHVQNSVYLHANACAFTFATYAFAVLRQRRKKFRPIKQICALGSINKTAGTCKFHAFY